MAEWSHVHPFLHALLKVVLFILPVFVCLPLIIWYERRLLSWMQDRIGPNRTGDIKFSRTSKWVPPFLRGKKVKMFGIPQVMADGIKSFLKEDFLPAAVDPVLYFAAPAVFLFPAFALGATIPWGPWRLLTPVADVNIGILYILAISSLSVYGVVLAGYSSNNKYSMLGGLRSSAQLISYELAMSMALAAVVMATGSLRPTDIVAGQETPLWGIPWLSGISNWNIFTPYGFIAGVIFFICMVAETNRQPFDLPEAESELVAGYNTEYSTKKWVLFMMGEYVGMVTYSAILITLFFGGYHLLPFNWELMKHSTPAFSYILGFLQTIDDYGAPIWLLGKIYLVISSYIWLRATLPRLRYDQLMSLGWKSLLPLGVCNLIVVGLWIVMTRVYGPWAGWAAVAVAAVILYFLYKALNDVNPAKRTYLASRTIEVVQDAPRREVEVVDPNAAPAS